MNQRQLKKREKRLNNEYWDKFQQLLEIEEIFQQAERLSHFQGQEWGECAVLTFQLDSLENWQGAAILKDGDLLTMYLQPADWLEELNLETCFFQWTLSIDEFQLKDWIKWVKPLKQAPLKAKVQAITLKKRLSEKQAQEWWENYEATERLAQEMDQEVLHEIKDYARMLPYQIPQIASVNIDDPVQVRTQTQWRTFPVYQIGLKIVFKDSVNEHQQLEILNRCQTQLNDEVYRSRSYECCIVN